MKPTIAELEKILDGSDGTVEIGPDGSIVPSAFRKDLAEVLNRHSKENGSNTPDFILATFLTFCLHAFDVATTERRRWYGDTSEPGKQFPREGT